MTRKKSRRACSGEGDGGYWFDERAASAAVEFIEKLLTHWQGEWAGRRFELLAWQRQVIRDVFGWKRKDGTRRYREVYIEVPKKNGKSPFAAAVALLCLFCDAEPGAEIYAIANDKDQARIVFNDSKKMVTQSPALLARSLVLSSTIVYPKTGSVYRPLSRTLATKHGQRPHALIFDELHEFRDRTLVDFLVYGTAARRQPLTVYITTAGVGQESICWEKHDYALKVQAWRAGDHQGGIEDDAFYPLIYAAAPEDDWTDPAVWAKANPSLGVTVKYDYLQRECAKAVNNPAAQNTFRRLHLNQWTGQHERAIDMRAWDACAERAPLEELRGRECYLGMDLSSKLDLTALVAAFPREDGSYDVLPFFWIPGDNIEERVRRDRAPYGLWVQLGLVQATSGSVVDHAAIRAKVNELATTYDVREIGFDPWNATQLSVELREQDGLDRQMIEMRQGYRTLSEPTKMLLGLVANGAFRHGGNRVLRWMADALALRKDPNDNWAPCKKSSTQRIDGIVASVMALGRATLHAGSVTPMAWRIS